jgi:hypothetical protein
METDNALPVVVGSMSLFPVSCQLADPPPDQTAFERPFCSVAVSAAVIRNISVTPVFQQADDSSKTSLGLILRANSRNDSESVLVRTVSSALAHMDFRPASFKVHIVHERFHQLDAAPMFGSGVRCEAVTHCFFEVESFSLIRHDDGYLFAGLAAAADVYFFFWIFLIAVQDRISQCFAERQFDIELVSGNALRPLNQPHQAVHQR